MTPIDLFINTKQKAFSTAIVFVCLSFAGFFSACGNKQLKQTPAPAEDSTLVYYPINNYIRQQIQDVDSTPYFLYRLRTVGGRKDSSVISRTIFDAETKPFVLSELEDKSFRSHFTESVFDDESTNSITLTYAPKDTNDVVQNASVLLNKENQRVKWIFINTLSNSGDSTVIQHRGWKGDKSCYLNKMITYANRKGTEVQTNFVWNEKKESE